MVCLVQRATPNAVQAKLERYLRAVGNLPGPRGDFDLGCQQLVWLDAVVNGLDEPHAARRQLQLCGTRSGQLDALVRNVPLGVNDHNALDGLLPKPKPKPKSSRGGRG